MGFSRGRQKWEGGVERWGYPGKVGARWGYVRPSERHGSSGGGCGIPVHRDVALVTAEQLGPLPTARPWGGEGP